MNPELHLSYSTTVVLQAIAQGYRYGFDVMDVSGLPSGTVYPALRRLERSGLLRSRWERKSVARRDQRPARRYYIITPAGRRWLVAGLTRFKGVEHVIPVAAPSAQESR